MDPSQIERLAILGEECGEVQQMVGKSIRFGTDTIRASRGTTNAHQLAVELADIFIAVMLMIEAEDIKISDIEQAIQAKLTRMDQKPLFQHPQPQIKWE